MSDEVVGGPCRTCGEQGVFNCCGNEAAEQNQFALTEVELKLCAEIPDILVSLADTHDAKASMAAAMGYRKSTDHHAARAEELRAEAKRIEATW